MRRPTSSSTLALCAALAGSLVASQAGAEPAKPIPPDRLVLNRVGLPIVWRGRLVNYVFVDVRLKLVPGGPSDASRAREPYLRDALVRDGHRTPFVDPGDLARIDERALDAALMREATSLLGPGVALAAEVTGQQPRRRTGLPRPAAEPPPAGRPVVP